MFRVELVHAPGIPCPEIGDNRRSHAETLMMPRH